MPRKGRALEKLVAHIESVLRGSGKAKVQSPAYVIDVVTGTKREIDVLITRDEGGSVRTIGFEVRDRKEKTGLAEMEAFKTKADNTRLDGKVFVSRSGYTKPALELAKKAAIRCLTLKEALSFDWLAPDAFGVVSTIRPTKVAYTIWPECEAAMLQEGKRLGLVPALEHMEITDSQGKAIDWASVGNLAWTRLCQTLGDGLHADFTGSRRATVQIETGQGYVLNVSWKGSTNHYPLRRIDATVEYSRDTEVLSNPFRLRNYTCQMQGKDIAQVAVGQQFEALDQNVRLVMVSIPGEGIKLSIEHESREARPGKLASEQSSGSHSEHESAKENDDT